MFLTLLQEERRAYQEETRELRAEIMQLTGELRNVTSRISEVSNAQQCSKNDSSATVIPENVETDHISEIEPVSKLPVRKPVPAESTAIEEVDSEQEEVPNFIEKEDEFVIEDSQSETRPKKKHEMMEIGSSSDSEYNPIEPRLDETNDEVSLNYYCTGVT